MKSTTFAIGSILASIAIAQPHRHAGHQAFHKKRADPPVVWTTELEYVYETVGVTTTIWVSEGEIVPTSSASSSVSASTTSSINVPIPAQFFETNIASISSTSTTAAPTTSSTSPVYVAPAPAPAAAYVAPAPAVVVPSVPSPEPVSAPAVETTAPVVVAPVVAAPVIAAEVPKAPVVSTPVVDTSATGSSYGACTKGDICGGDLTFYDPVMESWGACGWHNDGLKEKVIALPVGLMGAQSNGNPFCGRNVTIMHNGKSTTAMVVDKCMGCKGRDIDISRCAFDDLADQGVGRTTATWYFSD